METGGTDYRTYEGKTATVEIPFSKNEIGRISVILEDNEHEEFPARAFNINDPPYEKGDKVIVRKFDGSIAEIEKSVNWELKKLKESKKEV